MKLDMETIIKFENLKEENRKYREKELKIQ